MGPMQAVDGEVGIDVAHAASRLRSLASDPAKRSKTAVLADVFVEIENAIRAGVSQVAIVHELRRLGLDIGLGTFRSALRRLRASRARRPRWDPTGRTDFVPTPFGGEARSVRTTSSGSLYDESALHRLLLASGPPPARRASALAD